MDVMIKSWGVEKDSVQRCSNGDRAVLTRTRAGLGLRKGVRESLLSLREPGPVWPCVSVVAICVSIVANQKGSILTRFTTILTRTRAGLALRKGGRESLLSLRAENLRSGSFEKKSDESLV